MYCPRCGKEIGEDAKFCEYCGYSAKSIQTQPIPQIVTDREKEESEREIKEKGKKRLGVIHAYFGEFGNFCDLIFTESGLIVAETNMFFPRALSLITMVLFYMGLVALFMIAPLIELPFIESLLVLLLLALLFMITPLIERNKTSAKLSTLSPYEVLRASKSNFFIPYNGITKVELKKSFWMIGEKMIVYTSTRNYSFGFAGKKTALVGKQLLREYEEIIRNVLPDKLVKEDRG